MPEEPERPLPLESGSWSESEFDDSKELPESEDEADESHGVNVVVAATSGKGVVCAEAEMAEAARTKHTCASAIAGDGQRCCSKLLYYSTLLHNICNPSQEEKSEGLNRAAFRNHSWSGARSSLIPKLNAI